MHASFVFSFQYKIGSVLPFVNRESRTVEYKTGGGNYPLTILPLVNTHTHTHTHTHNVLVQKSCLLTDPQHIQKYGSAFLNSEGGVLIIGVADDGT